MHGWLAHKLRTYQLVPRYHVCLVSVALVYPSASEHTTIARKPLVLRNNIDLHYEVFRAGIAFT